MEVNKATNAGSASYTAAAQTNKKAEETNAANNTETAKSNSTATETETPAAVYEKSEKTTYTRDQSTVSRLKAETKARNQQLQDMVTKLLGQQYNTYGKSMTNLTKKNIESIINGGNLDQATIDKAKEDVSEDGYYGVKKTTERIMDFAKALSGGDPDKIDELREAVEKGFKLAAKMWGDELPEISQKTYDAVMSEFDKWKQSATGVTA